jgi:Tol biopolymer transport system component
VPTAGGTPVRLAQVDDPLGMSWGADGQVLVGQGPKGIVRVSAREGTIATVLAVAAGESARDPQFLPDGDHVLFTIARGTPAKWSESSVVVQSIRTGQRTEVVRGSDAHYVPSGQLVYVSSGRVLGVRFDARSLTTGGTPVVLAERVQTFDTTGGAQLSVGANGAVAFIDSRPAPVQLAWVTLDGRRENLGEVSPALSAPRLAADGKRLLIRNQDTREIFVGDVTAVNAAPRVISDATIPVLSPDGQWIVFGSLGTGRPPKGEEVLYRQRADGSGEPELIANPGRAGEQWIDPDRFTFITYREPLDYDLWLFRVSTKTVEPLATVRGSAQLSGSFSPDGKWFSYQSNEVNGEWQIFIQPYPTDGRTFQVTSAGGRSPAWVSGNEIVYDGDGQLFAVEVDFGSRVPTFSAPRELPVTGMIQRALRRNWDVSRASGEPRLLMQFRPGPRIDIVSNWVERLR